MSPTLNRLPGFYSLENTFRQKFTFVKTNSTTINTPFTAPSDWAGWGDILHGGFQGLLLDGIMYQAALELMDMEGAVPKALAVRYRRPVHVSKPLSISGHLVKGQGQEIMTHGEIKDIEGHLLTEAHGTLVRIEPESIGMGTSEGDTASVAQSEATSLAHWPTWPACCAGPLERLWDLHIDWRMAPDQSALAGFLRFPPALRQAPSAGALVALFDQAMGLLGRAQGHGVMLTVKIQVTIHRSLPVEVDLTLLSSGYRWLDGPFSAQARLQHADLLVAEASGSFKVHYPGT